MRRFIMTGAPGSGKTSILRALENLGYAVVEEAATDAIAAHHAQGHREPWEDPLFIDEIVQLQGHRECGRVRTGATVQVHDRSVVCTLALARWMDYPVTATLRVGGHAGHRGWGCSTAGCFFSRSAARVLRADAGPPIRAMRTRWPLSVSTKRSTCASGSSSWTFRPARSISGLR